ncbi:MAG: SDR family NAD(P)-dependent oxidoreductase [Nostocoides sp.]
MSGEFSGLVAVVTGGAAGIGEAIAAELTDRGAAVAVFDLDVAGVCAPRRGYPCNVTDRDSLAAATAGVAADLGGIDILVNNAGISAVGTVEENTDDEWARVLDVNVIGVARATAAALPYLRRSEHPAVVNLCSIAALNGLPQRVLYSATKGAVQAMTYAMATDHVHEGIRINAVSPGTVHTGFVDRMLATFPDPVAEKAALDARQATGRMVTVDEVAGAVAYLASPRSGSSTGTILDVDGGVTHLRVRPQS